MKPDPTFLGATPYVDKDHPNIVAQVAQLTADLGDDASKVMAIFHFVRDKIKFGFANGFWDNKASDVLRSGKGYCNTKSTLFVAMLRRANIPARQVFVEIDATVLRGILDPGTPFVDHSYVEVKLADEWIATDAYIVDAPLFDAASALLEREGALLGYGVHRTGTRDWDGKTPAFAQYNMLDPSPIGTKRWGVFADVGAFYRAADAPWNKLNGITRAAVGLFAAPANRRADDLRQERG